MEQVIKLQQTVIALLTKAQDLDLQTILLPKVAQVLSGTVSARDTSVSALKEQFQRMAVAAPFNTRRLNSPEASYALPWHSQSGVREIEPPTIPQNTARVSDTTEEAEVELAEDEVRALYSYEGVYSHSLSFKWGDVIKVLTRDIPSRTGKRGVIALGKTRNGKIGAFLLEWVEGPGKTSPESQSRVQEIKTTTTPQNSTSESNTTKEAKVELAKDEVVAQISFRGNPSASLSFEKGDIIKVLTRDIVSRHGKKGFVALGRTCDGVFGTFFLSCVEGPGKTSPQSSGAQAQCDGLKEAPELAPDTFYGWLRSSWLPTWPGAADR